MALHSSTLPYIAVHSSTLPYIAVHSHTHPYMALHSSKLPYIAVHSSTSPYIAIHSHTHLSRLQETSNQYITVTPRTYPTLVPRAHWWGKKAREGLGNPWWRKMVIDGAKTIGWQGSLGSVASSSRFPRYSPIFLPKELVSG